MGPGAPENISGLWDNSGLHRNRNNLGLWNGTGNHGGALGPGLRDDFCPRLKDSLCFGLQGGRGFGLGTALGLCRNSSDFSLRGTFSLAGTFWGQSSYSPMEV